MDLRSQLCEVRANKSVLEKELQKLLLQLHAAQLKVHARSNNNIDSETIKTKLESEIERYRKDALREAVLESEVELLKTENEKMRQDMVLLQGELFGARLAARYLDKELAGRIQQIQLLGRDMRGVEHDKLWNQLEAEIHLHRHKTVIRACRKRNSHGHRLSVPPGHDSESLRKRQGIGEIRRIVIEKEDGEGLGISVTGGREHGVPILISEIREGLAADRSGIVYVGDAILSVNGIDLRDMKHKDAVDVIVQQPSVVNMEVLFVAPDDEEDKENEFELNSGGEETLLGVASKLDEGNTCESSKGAAFEVPLAELESSNLTNYDDDGNRGSEQKNSAETSRQYTRENVSISTTAASSTSSSSSSPN